MAQEAADRIGESSGPSAMLTEERRLLMTRVVLAVGFLAGLLLTPRSWTSLRLYPLVPLLPFLPSAPYPGDCLLFGALILSLTLMAVFRKPRPFIVTAAALSGLLALGDQSRWQPWFFQYLFLLLALGSYRRTGEESRTLNTCRLIVACGYFWGGVHKLNLGFVTMTFPGLLSPFTGELSRSARFPVQLVALAAALTEIGVGMGLLTRRWRKPAVVMAVAIHAFILICLGPFGQNANSVVWPWNAALALFDIILFWRAENTSVADVVRPRGSRVHALALVFFGILPALALFNLWDSYLSFDVYTGNQALAKIRLHGRVKERLPEPLRSYVETDGQGDGIVDITQWSYSELNQPPYPERRVYARIARHFRRWADSPSDVVLEITEKRPLFSLGKRTVTLYDLDQLGP